VEVPDVRDLQARSHVPVDVPDVVVVLVFTQIGQVEALAAEERPVVAVQEPVQPFDHRPFEPPQEVLSQP
jgi:hypothetical protein